MDECNAYKNRNYCGISLFTWFTNVNNKWGKTALWPKKYGVIITSN